jgi:hypothetical protein
MESIVKTYWLFRCGSIHLIIQPAVRCIDYTLNGEVGEVASLINVSSR